MQLRNPAAIMLASLLVGSAASAQATQPASKQAEVPVTTVVLFSSGVGYFEHFGTIAGDGATELRFKTNQINDILKSLVLQDLDRARSASSPIPRRTRSPRRWRVFRWTSRATRRWRICSTNFAERRSL